MNAKLRPNVSGATIFFTVYLSRLGSTLMTDHIARLRAAVRVTKSERPFEIDAWFVLPDHMHCIWKLPVGGRRLSDPLAFDQVAVLAGLTGGCETREP